MRYMITIEAYVSATSEAEAERVMFAGSSAVEEGGASIQTAIVTEVGEES